MKAETPLLQFLLVTVARENGKPGIFRETRIADGKFAQVEDRTTIGFDAPDVEALVAKTCARPIRYLVS